MKTSSTNTFTEGMVCDLDPINVPNNVLTDCLNGTIITYDGNEFSLQNDKGNYPLKDCKLRPNFIPLGIKEHGGILYIVSLNPLTGEEEIGSYPSPKLYDGGTPPHGDLNVEYVIDKAFEEANSEELDYSELESKCKSWYYADPKLKLNVDDKFWFEEELGNTNFEKIEKYIIDENSIPHLVSNNWLNKSLEYTSPISGTMILKNKIFEIANSSAETNTFTCWLNEQNPDPDLENSYINVKNVNDVLGEICLIYDYNGTWITIENPSEPEQPASTSQYTTYDSHKLTIHSDTNGYYITSTGVNNYFLRYDPTSDSGLSFSLYHDNSIYWSIDDQDGYLRIRPVVDQNCSINYHDKMIQCDRAGAGHIQIIKKNLESEDSDIFVNNIASLFSFTHKIYIDDNDTLQWLTNDYLKYKVNLKINDSIIYSNIFDGNSLISDSKIFGEYEIDIESRQATNLEWYSNNKIVSKYFVTVIKNIDSNDQISAEIIPIVSISDTKNIIMSQFAKSLDNSVSEYTSTTWTIGEEYRFYNHPIDNVYKTQYIELDIKGPIEASDDLVLKCNIKDYDNKSSKKVITFNNVIVGKNLITIEYDDDFVKEDAYWVDYSINISGSVVKSEEKLLITSELFNYDDYRSYYKDYTDIPNNVWISRYEKTIIGGAVTMTLDGTKTDLPKSLYTYITDNEDYVNRNISNPNFIEESSYLEYSKFKEARLSGNLYNASISVKDPTYLTGPLWIVHENPYVYTDALGKQPIVSSESKLKVPVGIGRYVNFNSASKVIVGRIINTYEINPSTVTCKWMGNFDVNGNGGLGKWTLNLWKNETLLKTYELIPDATAVIYHDYTSEIKKLFTIDSDLVNIRVILSGHDYQNIVRMQWNTQTYSNTEVVIKNACQSTDSWFVSIPDPGGIYVKIDSDKDEKYQYGYWCSFSLGSELHFADPEINVSKRIVVKSKIDYEKTFVWNSSIKHQGTDVDLSIVDSEISNINSRGNNDKAEFDNIVSKYIRPSVGEYVKGVVDSGNKAYTIRELSENYRNTGKLEMKGGGYSNYLEWTPWLEVATPGGGTTQYNNITAYFACENGE